MKKLNQRMPEHDKALSSAKTEEDKAAAKAKKLDTVTGLRTCNNILTMTQPLRSKAPSFTGDDKITLSWLPSPKNARPSTPNASGKRAAPTANTSNNASNKRGRGKGGAQSPFVNQTLRSVNQSGGGSGQGGRGEGGMKSQFASRALKGLFHGGRGGGRGRGQGGRGRGRGRGY